MSRNRNTANEKSMSYYADKMISRIVKCVKDELQRNTSRIETAIVTQVNTNGTVNVSLPADENSKFTNISNQTPFELFVGDSVEIMLKNGSFSNCWIIAKHGATFLPKNTLQ